MKQDFPAGKAVEPRHLQKFRVYAPHAVAQVDHHRRNGGCGHDEYTGPAVKPKPYQSQHNPAYRRHRLEHMDERRPTSSSLGHRPNSRPRMEPTAIPIPRPSARRSRVVPTVGQKSGSRISHASVPATCGTGGSTRGEKQSEASCQTPSSRPTPRRGGARGPPYPA